MNIMGRDSRATEGGMSAVARRLERIASPQGMLVFTNWPGVLWNPRLHPGNLQSIYHDCDWACNDLLRSERYHSERLAQSMNRLKYTGQNWMV